MKLSFKIPFTKHKYFSLDLAFLKLDNELVYFRIDWSKNHDHAGLTYQSYIFGLNFDWSIADERHWNEREDKWYEMGEDIFGDDPYITNVSNKR